MTNPDIDALIASATHPQDIEGANEITQIRMSRRVLADELRAAVRAQDGGQVQLCVHRLSRLGVTREDIEKIVLGETSA